MSLQPYIRPAYKVKRNGVWVIVPAAPVEWEKSTISTKIRPETKRKKKP